MTQVLGSVFNFADKLQMQSLNFRNQRNNVLAANIANAETPGYRAFAFDFEKQLQAVANMNEQIAVKVSHPMHFKNAFTSADGKINPEVYIRPNESVGEDGNTVDLDGEMAQLAQNQILFRATVETINRKIGIVKYAINGGR